MDGKRIGVMYDRALPLQGLAEFARSAEATGVDELWVVEDLGYGGAVSAATAALAATSRIKVGIGIAPAPLRNPALLAMELATIAAMFPGRLIAGIGHGVPDWMAQVGAMPSSPLALLEEVVTAVRMLLRGEAVTLHGREVHLEGVRLVHTPHHAPDLVVGVVRPRSLELSGRVADGTILAEGHGPAIADQAAWLERVPGQLFSAVGPQGTAAQAAARVRELWSAGADSVVLRPVGRDPIGQLGATLAELR